MKPWPIIVALGVLAGVGGMLYSLRTAPELTATPQPAVLPPVQSGPSPEARPLTTALPPAQPVVPATGPGVPVPAVIDQSRPAELSMAEAREKGDPRMPPVARVPETDSPPTAAELADPRLYQRYEQRQSNKGYSDFVKAADAQIPQLQQALQQAQQQGATPEQLAKGQEKLRRLQEMRDQLLSQHPDIAH